VYSPEVVIVPPVAVNGVIATRSPVSLYSLASTHIILTTEF
jgi:hypothetical protein